MFPHLRDGPFYTDTFFCNWQRLVLNEHFLTKICESETRNSCCQLADGWGFFVLVSSARNCAHRGKKCFSKCSVIHIVCNRLTINKLHNQSINQSVIKIMTRAFFAVYKVFFSGVYI